MRRRVPVLLTAMVAAAAGVSSVSAEAASPDAAAPVAPAAPGWYCAPVIQPVCQVVGFVLCRKPFTCPEIAVAATVPAAAAAAPAAGQVTTTSGS